MRARHDLEGQRVCSTMRTMSLCVKEVKVWNSLCDDLKIVNTVAAFKGKCKNLLFKNYMSRCFLMFYFVYEFVTSI